MASRKPNLPTLLWHRSVFHSLTPAGEGGRKKVTSDKVSSRVSLSDFLDRKLHKSRNAPPKTVRGKLTPFISPLGARGDIVFTSHHTTKNNQFVFDQFKHSGVVKESVTASPGSCETETFTPLIELGLHHEGSSDLDDGTRKRRCPFDGSAEVSKGLSSVPLEETSCPNKGRAFHKPLLVLGDNPAPKRKEREEKFTNRSKKPKGVYNHYGNGCGWWDCDREGVDAEEVGFGDIWEGVGSTTFGEIIDWH